MTHYDVAVVGAGPAGSVAARDLAAAGLSVLLLEEHDQVGKPVHCAGLVTSRTLEAAGLDESVVLNRIRGAIVHTPQGNQVVLGGDREHALVIDRMRLDQILAEQAQDAGAELVMERRLVGLEDTETGVRLQLRHGREGSVAEATLLIGAPPPAEAIVAAGGDVQAGTSRRRRWPVTWWRSSSILTSRPGGSAGSSLSGKGWPGWAPVARTGASRPGGCWTG